VASYVSQMAFQVAFFPLFLPNPVIFSGYSAFILSDRRVLEFPHCLDQYSLFPCREFRVTYSPQPFTLKNQIRSTELRRYRAFSRCSFSVWGIFVTELREIRKPEQPSWESYLHRNDACGG
jgi:hypothetical protein